MVKTIYLDNQASTPVDPRVLAKMLPFLQDGYGNPHSLDHVVGWRAAEVVEQARQTVASAIGSDSDEVIVTSGATESNNLALQGLFQRNTNAGRKTVLISAVEHKCIVESAQRLASAYGAVVKLIPVNREGVVDVDFIETELRQDGVLMVSVMAVNNEVGSIQPIREIGALARKNGAIFHCDAAQALTTLDINVFDDNVDLLSISGHKIYGPQGVGALFIRRDLQGRIEPSIYGGGQQAGLRSGTVPVFLCAGLAAAIEVLGIEIAAGEREVIAKKRNKLVNGILSPHPQGSVLLNGPPLSIRHQGNTNLLFLGVPNHDLLGALQPRIAASTGSACTSGTPEPSYVLRAMGLTEEDAASSVRFSVGRFTTNDDIENAIEAINEVISRLV